MRTTASSYVLAANVENLIGTAVNGQALTGNSIDNTITAGNGNDMLDGGAGADILVGGLGNDVYLVDSLGDTVTELANAGSDEIRTALASYSIAAVANVENLTGTAATGQALTGNSLDNTITGGAGNDTLDGGAGNDTLDGGTGNDTMSGGLGNDVYIVDSAADTITEAANEGIDEARTALASYSMAAIANVEKLTGTAATGQALTGNSLANTVTGGAGNDTLDGDAGNDTLIGGLGNDVYIVDSAADTITEAANAGTDEAHTTAASYVLATNVENLVGLLNSGQTLTGNSLVNTITGGAGNDTLDGKAGTDTLIGGVGNDVYIVDNFGDTITEVANEGTDEVRTALASYTLGIVNVENLTGTATIGQALTGSSIDNTIAGGTGSDTLDGGAGNDTLIGGRGNDIYIVDSVGDTIIEAANEGTDEVRTTLSSYSMAAAGNVEKLTGTAATGQALTGNASITP